MEKLKKAIFSTLAYADVFDYPLTAEELYRFLITDKPLSQSAFKQGLTRIYTNEKRIDTNGKHFFLKGRGEIAALRKKRAGWSRRKLRIAERVARWLRLIPWVKMVGVTGSLTLLNSDKDDDIDILIVSARNRLWLTRFLVTILVELTGRRRHPPKTSEISLLTKNRSCDNLSTREFKDKVCLNMFLDEDHLAVPKKEQDLFSAHEVCQMRLLWDKDDTYKKFLWQNRWVRKYLPNTLSTTNKDTKHHEKFSGISCFHSWLLVFERLAKNLQLWYMAKRRTTEVISDGIIRFHPQDARTWVLAEYRKRLEKLGIS